MEASTTTATTTNFLRKLAENNDGTGNVDNATSPAVFWGVNAFILFLLVSACCWCCCIASSFERRDQEGDENDGDNEDGEDSSKRCGPCGRLLDCVLTTSRTFHFSPTITSRQTSDEAYRDVVLRRRQQEVDARRDSPEKRKRKLLQSFQRCGNRMIVEASDILEPTENVGNDPVKLEEESSSSTTPTSHGVKDDESSAPVIIETGIPMGTDTVEKDTAESSPAAVVVVSEEKAVPTESEAPAAVAVADDEENATAAAVEAQGEGDDNDDDDAASTSSASSEATNTDGYLMLRSSNPSQPTRRRVPNCCAICLCPYEVGEAVVWSANVNECPHAYHEDCILDWLVKMHQVQQHRVDSGQGGSENGNANGNVDSENQQRPTIGSSLNSTPCPCCRADFTDLEKYRKEKRIKWSAGAAFNPGAIAWR